jgi:Kef-type K+ transport system membrane component KefB
VTEPIATLILSLAIILVAAKVMGHLATLAGQPPVLGELVAGIVLGNLALVGVPGVGGLKDNPALDLLSQLGVIILLFQVGLESTVTQMFRVGLSSLVVATVGVITPFLLGWGVSAWLLPGSSSYTHVFIGATLTATSVGITARVLKDLGRAQSDEARIILGAAVIDDVQGLVMLAIVTGLIGAVNVGRPLSYGRVALVVAEATLFLFGALAVGMASSRRLFRIASKLDETGVLLAFGLAFCFVLAWTASAIGLAPIVGAFAAGLILDEVHYRDLRARDHRNRDIPQLLEPLTAFLVPVFFVLMGMRVDLSVFGTGGVIGFAAVLTLAAVAGKQICAFGVLEKKTDRLAVGLGMIPRGEVGLIFAGIGSTLMIGGERVVDGAVFSAVVVMVALTTLVTPPLLVWRLKQIKES